MTPTSEERREVAARLRALHLDTYAAIREWEEGGLFIDANLSDEADYSQIHNAVFGCFPAEHMHPGDYEELHERLADLIDPTCEVKDDNRLTSDTCDTGVAARRDTPASLADELEAWCDRVDVDGDACDKPRALAERIRRLAAKEDKR